MVTAEKQTSTPLGSQDRRRHGNQAIYRNRFTPELLHDVPSAGERKRVFEGMATGRSGEVHGEVAATDQVAVEVTGNTRLFHEAVAPHVERVVAVNPQPVQGHHAFGEEDGSQ